MTMSWVEDTRRLRNLARTGDQRANTALEFIAMETAARAQGNIRNVGAIDTGFMVNTTAARKISDTLWSIGTAAFYGVFIEFGTIHMAARPWLQPAMKVGLQRLATALRGEFGRG
tara:strand:+ start:1189 stop:1533 length:345 start_codon:yes stop_codon:yes gene_type:complete